MERVISVTMRGRPQQTSLVTVLLEGFQNRDGARLCFACGASLSTLQASGPRHVCSICSGGELDRALAPVGFPVEDREVAVH